MEQRANALRASGGNAGAQSQPRPPQGVFGVLTRELQRAVADAGYETPTPIQEQCIPQLLEGRDLLGCAQTGTGKTAAFGLPMIHLLLSAGTKPERMTVRGLILAPTRELAAQINDSIRAYSRHQHLRSLVVFGGASIRPQIGNLSKGVHTLVATPGRLLDLVGQRRLALDAVEFFVLDEADRMLDMGFVRDVRKIISALPKTRQSLLFSATMPDEVARLSGEILADPIRVEVTPQATPIERLEQKIYHVDAAGKRALLASILNDPALSRVIVFARTKHRANRVAQQLERCGVDAEAIHGNKSQAARTRALSDFKAGRVRVLVATDIAARGLDINRLPHVVNYELPNVPEDYVHRIGRTARAGLEGHAISLVCIDEHKLLADIEKLLQKKIRKESIAGYTPDPRIKAEPITQGRQQRAPSKPKNRRRKRSGVAAAA